MEFRKWLEDITAGGLTVQSLEQYNKDWHFVNFSKIEKLGINPQFSHETPNAIYSYRVSDILQGRATWASKHPFINVFTVKEHAKPYIIDIEKVDEQIYRIAGDDRAKAVEAIKQVLPQLPRLPEMVNNVIVDRKEVIGSFLYYLINSGAQGWRSVNVWNPDKKKAPQSPARKQIVATGIRGYFTGRSAAAWTNHECVFYFPTDLIVVDRIVNQSKSVSTL